MPTRLARGRWRALVTLPAALVVLAVLVCAPLRGEAAAAPAAGMVAADAPCAVGLLGLCLVGGPSPTPTPTASGYTATPAAPAAAAPQTPLGAAPAVVTPASGGPLRAVASAVAAPLAALGSVGRAVGQATAGVATPGARAAAAPGCTTDVLGNCISLLPGVLSPPSAPNPGAPPGISLTLPLGDTSLPVLSLATPGCVAALLGLCAASSQPTGTQPASCTATLLSLCIPGGAQPGSAPTCLLSGVACVNVPGLPGGPSQGRAPGARSPAGGADAAGLGSGAGAGGATVTSDATTDLFNSGAPVPGLPQQGALAPGASPLTALPPPAIPSSSTLGGLEGLNLGSLRLWPIFIGLDLLAALLLAVVVRRSWSAAAAD